MKIIERKIKSDDESLIEVDYDGIGFAVTEEKEIALGVRIDSYDLMFPISKEVAESMFFHLKKILYEEDQEIKVLN